MNKCQLCEITKIKGCYNMKCLVCSAYLVLAHRKESRAKMIAHWSRQYGHDEGELKSKIIEINKRNKIAKN